jgi:hypothetical protein
MYLKSYLECNGNSGYLMSIVVYVFNQTREFWQCECTARMINIPYAKELHFLSFSEQSTSVPVSYDIFHIAFQTYRLEAPVL